MPLYDFECPKCGHTEEVLYKDGDDIPECENDGEAMFQLFVNKVSIRKGSGSTSYEMNTPKRLRDD